MSESSTVVQIKSKFEEIQNLINNDTEGEDNNLRGKFAELVELIKAYEEEDPTEDSIVDDINYALRNQSLSIEEREELLNTKLKQVEVASARNAQTKNMLTVFVVINVVVLLVFVTLIVMKANGRK